MVWSSFDVASKSSFKTTTTCKFCPSLWVTTCGYFLVCSDGSSDYTWQVNYEAYKTGVGNNFQPWATLGLLKWFAGCT